MRLLNLIKTKLSICLRIRSPTYVPLSRGSRVSRGLLNIVFTIIIPLYCNLQANALVSIPLLYCCSVPSLCNRRQHIVCLAERLSLFYWIHRFIAAQLYGWSAWFVHSANIKLALKKYLLLHTNNELLCLPNTTICNHTMHCNHQLNISIGICKQSWK